MSATYTATETVQASQVTGTLTNFPALFSRTSAGGAGIPDFRTVGNGGKVKDASGYDLNLFTSSALTSLLDQETILYVASTGQVIKWARVASIATATVVYWGYGDSAISTSQDNTTGVWRSEYKAVYHLEDNAASTTVAESTSNANTATNVANTSGKTTTGKVSAGLTYNGSSDGTTAPSISALNNVANMSYSCWVKPAGLKDYGGIMVKSDTPAYERFGILSSGTGFSDNSAVLTVFGTLGGGSLFAYTAASQLVVGTWTHIAATWDGSQSTDSTRHKVYVNGVAKTLTFYSGTPSGAIANTTDPIKLGVDRVNTYYNCTIDEARAYAGTQTAEWYEAEYKTANAPTSFWGLGSERDRLGLPSLPQPTAMIRRRRYV